LFAFLRAKGYGVNDKMNVKRLTAMFGTFCTQHNEGNLPLKDFYDGAFWLAIKTQTLIAPVIFPDALQRWHYSAWWKLWP
jgi:1-acyl-sn-glycerol-3-phosphate acyltransferase